MLVYETIAEQARLRRDHVALVEGDRNVTYGLLIERVRRWVDALGRLGVRPGERVAVLSPNSVEFFEWYLAMCAGGFVGVPLNFRLTAGELADYLSYAGAKVLVTHPLLAGLGRDAAERSSSVETLIGFGADHGQPLDVDVLLGAADPGVTLPPGDPEAPVLISPTSGTTGAVKGTVISQRNTWCACMIWLSGLRFDSNTRRLQAVQTSFATGGSHYTTLFVGGRIVMLPKFDIDRVLDAIQTHRITQTTLPPAMMNQLIDRNPSAAQLSSLSTLNVGGAPFDPSRFESAVELLGDRVTVAFGLTETSATATMLWPDDYAGADGAPRRLSVGRPWPGVKVRVMDDDGVEVPQDGKEIGEIRIGGPTVSSGYWEMPEETATAFRNGWFLTGDLATVDQDGFVYIVDRKKDVIVSGGINIGSLEVEQVIAAHPAVAAVAVVGIPDERWGEAVHAVVVRRPGADVDEDMIIAWCRDRLASFKKPRSVDFVDELPTNANGKLLKRELRERYWSARGGTSRVV